MYFCISARAGEDRLPTGFAGAAAVATAVEADSLPPLAFAVPQAPSTSTARAVKARVSRGRREERANVLVELWVRVMRPVSDHAEPGA
ncbi:hypothetical protein GCM10010497_24110 [Streptomyces cinereoruber]|uniref:Uncharacterized protein n=1 Tax=Streptomyces cinereoruber TaxID=67260 RepID=A0AAV4KIC7_9ACTN|nr:hypothetical protein C5L38_00510 [Streptomyces sp. WAC00288]KYG51821.1 hypothetical protein AWI43_31170 [Streptomyces sp. WAC04657]QEV36504.1 hypothetical protein CP977_33680 [Streptomyces cinereoruber]GGR20935.1 hypothetical protein GCM10010497_24110 [Streptomyces cinereoruber]